MSGGMSNFTLSKSELEEYRSAWAPLSRELKGCTIRAQRPIFLNQAWGRTTKGQVDNKHSEVPPLSIPTESMHSSTRRSTCGSTLFSLPLPPVKDGCQWGHAVSGSLRIAP